MPQRNLDDIEQFARIVTPILRQSLKPDFDEVVNRCEEVIKEKTDAIDKHLDVQTEEINEKITTHDDRLKRLEKFALKGLAGWTVLVAIWGIVVAGLIVALNLIVRSVLTRWFKVSL